MAGVPVICENGSYKRVTGLEIGAFQQQMLDRTVSELAEEREAVSALL